MYKHAPQCRRVFTIDIKKGFIYVCYRFIYIDGVYMYPIGYGLLETVILIVRCTCCVRNVALHCVIDICIYYVITDYDNNR